MELGQPWGLKLAEQDNVAVVIGDADNGQAIDVSGQLLVVRAAISLGHKVSLANLEAGDPVIKCGVAIGTATSAIAAGDHVHLHNIRSNFLPTYTLADDFGE